MMNTDLDNFMSELKITLEKEKYTYRSIPALLFRICRDSRKDPSAMNYGDWYKMLKRHNDE